MHGTIEREFTMSDEKYEKLIKDMAKIKTDVKWIKKGMIAIVCAVTAHGGTISYFMQQ